MFAIGSLFSLRRALVLGALISLLIAFPLYSIDSVYADDASSTPPSDSSVVTIPDASQSAADGTSGTDGTSDIAAHSGSDTSAGTEAGDASTTESNTSLSSSAIATGDASSTSNVVTDENSNATNIDAPATTTVESDSSGTASTSVEQSSQSGGNMMNTSGPANIASGDTFSAANVVNVVNANITDSTGLILLLNRLSGGTLDLSHTLSTPSNCTLLGCSQESVQFNASASSTADISNDVIVRSISGQNAATTTGDATISTGDAFAAANVLNVANLNAIGSTYLLLSVNNFGNMAGDILLPGAGFFSNLACGAVTTAGGETAIATNNSAAVGNTIGVSADSGHNTASTTEGATIATGNAGTGAGVANEVNGTQVGGCAVHILLRVFGNWNGNVFGLPQGLSWTQTPTGIELFGSGAGVGEATAGNFALDAKNTARINNNVSVLALTGDNHVDANAATIDTGNAYAAANVINIANQNFIGTNWIYAIFNIMGDWAGNLVFAQPNLWIGASGSGGLHPDSNLGMTFTVANRGKADATHVTLALDFDPSLLSLSGENTSTLDVGTIAAGETKTFNYSGSITHNVPMGSTPLPIKATVTSTEPDADMSDNADHLALVIQSGDGNVGATVSMTPDDDLHITKTASSDHVVGGGTIDYTIHIENRGGPAYHAELFDTLKNENGKTVSTKKWWLNTIGAGEEVNVTYTMRYATDTPTGLYTNEAQVKAIDRNPSLQPFYGWYGFSPVASTTVQVNEPDVDPMAQLCSQYLTAYIGNDQQNDESQVKRLQAFLHGWEGFDSLSQTGVYDPQTFDAVVAFQEKYRADILDPWGIQSGTGYVYYTTRKKVNDEFCMSVNGTTFPLTDDQKTEIDSFKSSGLGSQLLPHTGKVGNQRVGYAPKKTLVAVPKNPPTLLTVVTPTRPTPKVPNTGVNPPTGSSQTASAAPATKSGFWGNLVNAFNNAMSVTMSYER